jgi:hypothetical protein
MTVQVDGNGASHPLLAKRGRYCLDYTKVGWRTIQVETE